MLYDNVGGYIDYSNEGFIIQSVRPSVTLIPNTKITKGTGIIDDPLHN